jgi:hypothetical protein
MTRLLRGSIAGLLFLFAVACSDSGAGDAGSGGDGAIVGRDASAADSGLPLADTGPRDAGFADTGLASDTGLMDQGVAVIDTGVLGDDGGSEDTGPSDSGPSYNCGAFSTDPGWTVQQGFRAVVVADQTEGLSQPVAIAFAGRPFDDRLYVVSQGNNTLASLDVFTGTSSVVVAPVDWPASPGLLTTITWDEEGVFDGNLYVGDQGSDADGDSRIYRVSPSGSATTFASAPGPAMDDLYALLFVRTSSYTSGLYVSGDTDGAGPDWARIDVGGNITAFSEVAGIEGATVDRSGLYGRRIIASRPSGGGYAGDGTISTIEPNGALGPVIASNLGGVHAVVQSPGGTFGPYLYAASWSAGQLIRVSPNGMVDIVASGLQLTNYDGNILAFSPDGNVLYVADRQANRVVCIEPL